MLVNESKLTPTLYLVVTGMESCAHAIDLLYYIREGRGRPGVDDSLTLNEPQETLCRYPLPTLLAMREVSSLKGHIPHTIDFCTSKLS